MHPDFRALAAKPHFRIATFDRSLVNIEGRTVLLTFASATPVERYWGIEILDMANVKMERWTNSPPFMQNHWERRGVIESGAVKDGKLSGIARLSRNEDATALLNDMVDGIAVHTSVGYMFTSEPRELKPEEMSPEIKRMVLEAGKPAFLCAFEPFEGSSVDIPADPSVGLGKRGLDFYDLEDISDMKKVLTSIRSFNPQESQSRSTTTSQGGSTMTPEEIAAAQEKARKEAAQAERQRIQEIGVVAADFSHLDNIETLRSTAVNDGATTVDAFTRSCMNAQRDQRAEIESAAREYKDVAGIADLATQARNENWTGKKFRDEMRKLLTAGSKPHKTATPGAPDKTSPIIAMRDFVQPWQRRAAVGLSLLVARHKGSDTLTRKWEGRMRQLEEQFTPQLQDAEIEACVKRIMESKLPYPQQMRLMSTLTDGAGKYLITPAPLFAEIFTLVEAWGDARRYFRPVSMITDTLKLNAIVTKAIAYHVAEGSNITAADLVFGQGTLTAVKIAGISSWTAEADEDQAVALLPIYIESIAEAIQKLEDLDGFVANAGGLLGTSSTFTGLINFGTAIVTMAAGKTSFADADADDWRLLRDAVPRRHRMGAQYFMPPDSVSQLEGLRDLQGNYIYRPPSGDLPARLWGYPIANSDGIEALGALTDAAGTKYAAFCNGDRMLMGQRREVETVVSSEGVLDNGTDIIYNALQADGSIVRTTERVGFKGTLAAAVGVMKTAAV